MGRIARFAGGGLLGLLGLLLAAGCSEWDKYWERDASPLAPDPVPDLAPPTVRLVDPAGADSTGATAVGGSGYTVRIEASDDVRVVAVELRINDGPALPVSGPPWRFIWDTTSLDEGSAHRLQALARDTADNETESDPAWARVFNSGPRGVITDPLNGALVKGSIPLAVEFPGEHAPVVRVELSANVWTVATLTAPPWTTTLDTNTLPPGEHYLVARATSSFGATGVGVPVKIHVNNGAPEVSVDFPPADFAVATRGRLLLRASAVDEEEGPLPGDRFTWESDLDGPLGTGPRLLVSHLTPGHHTITATAANAWETPGSASVPVEVLAEPTYDFCNDIEWDLFATYFCTFCHDSRASEYQNSLLDVRSYDSLMAGGQTTIFPIVSPCLPESSLVYNKITSDNPWIGNPMPPFEFFPRVPPSVAERLRVWILEGAPPDDPVECP